MDIEVAEAIIGWEDHPDIDHFVEVRDKQFEYKSRWSIYYSKVYKDKRDNTFWEINWGEGATEYQDGQDEDLTVSRVYPHEVTKTEYLPTPSATDT